VEHRQVEDRPATSWRASGDDPARFLRELRQLRDGAGLGQAELAARAHYPSDRIRAAEVGPTLPDLPMLSAYVRGCGGTTEEWEERWRSLTSAPTLPLLDARPAGCSTAASAGARIGSISQVADTPDPSVIMAALDRVGEEMAVGTPAPPTSRAGVSTIEQRPGVPPAAAKSAGGKAGAGKVTAWETSTMRTAWSPATGPAREADQPPVVVGPTAPTEAGTAAAEGVKPAAAHTGPAGSAAAASAKTESGGSAGSAAVKPVAGTAPSSTKAPSPAAPAAVGRGSRRSRALSRTTIVALTAIAICVLVALLALLR
jgi:Helix-turn-helix domain